MVSFSKEISVLIKYVGRFSRRLLFISFVFVPLRTGNVENKVMAR